MRRYIEKLTSSKYGYTYDEVSEMLKGLGINLSGSRIKYLIGELKKNTHRRQKAEPSDNKNPSSNPATENQPTVKASSEGDKQESEARSQESEYSTHKGMEFQ
jgi:hypothetical protein